MTTGDDAGVVLTGGASRRMGRDKALVAVGGLPLARRVADTLADAGCRPVWCQGGDVGALELLGLDVVVDEHPGSGPVGAIASALRHAAGSSIVVAACDLPDLSIGAVERLRAVAGAAPGVDVVVASHGGRLHLVSWWSPRALTVLDRLLATGERSYRAAIESSRHVEVEFVEGDVRNVNHPGDLG